MPTDPGATWEALPGCSCARCCCCPPTVYYPPTLNVTWKGYNTIVGASTASFTISCVWPDCPRGTEHGGTPSECCTDYHFDDETEEYVCVGPTGPVDRCHACNYTLLGADGTPGIKVPLNEFGQPVIPPDTPKVLSRYITEADYDPGYYSESAYPLGTPLYLWIVGFGFFCTCGGSFGAFPAIPTYVNPDDGIPCGWQGSATVYEAPADGLVPYCGPVIGYCPPSTMVFNQGILVGDGDGDYPNPPFKLFRPLDPFKFSCCPLRARFLFSQYEPEYWCDSGDSTFWSDPSEWPPHPGESIPWNFPVPFCAGNPTGGCGYAATGTACGCVGGATWDCETNPDPDFGYVEITGDASCFLPSESDTNCLNALQPDDNENAC